MFDKYYKLLEIPNNASDEEVKRAYRKMAIKHHPDKNPDNPEEAEKNFKEIAEAYEILTNKDKYRSKNMANHFRSNFNPHDIFNQIFQEMNIGRSKHPFTSGMNVSINIPGNMQTNCVTRSTSVKIENGKKIETIRETINGQTRQRVIVTSFNKPNIEKMPTHIQDVLNNLKL